MQRFVVGSSSPLAYRRLAVLLALLGTACARAPRRAADTSGVTFVHVNDIYVVDTLRDGSGGLARVAALRDSLAARAPGSVLLTFGGDLLGPSLLSKWYSGAQMIEALSAAGVRYAVLGNHEFDYGARVLRERLAASPFRWLSANCAQVDGTPLPNVRGWDTLTVGGVRVGIFGVTIVSEYGSAGRCREEDVAARAAVDTLVAVGAQQIVALTHRYVHEDVAMLAADPRIRMVLGGHEHEEHRDTVPGGRLVLKAASNARSAWVVRIDGAGRLRDTLVRMQPGAPFQPATAAVVARWRDTLARRIGPDRVVARTAAVIDAVDSTSRNGESILGALVADAVRYGLGVDIGMVNSGTLRYDDYLGPGEITRQQLESIFLFADETRVVSFPISGARLRDLLEHSVNARNLGGGGSVQVSGVRVRYDPTRPPGSRIVGAIERDNGAVIAGSDTVRLAFTAYLACRGGDGYRIPEAASACAALQADATSAPRVVDLLIAHLEQRLGGVVRSPVMGRIGPVARPDSLE
ncbi:MAG: 5'-nucleotidase C-terminal domain-containing protein [Gemmatimonadaceae bacterium]|jgi:5'-nucleotidase|nr:5'-nucleotidase C-terminal domain-containing protein [Gemmatimonadaceae bacterium]